MAVTQDDVKIGKLEVPLEQAVRWVTTYTDAHANESSKRPYAYPAYDRHNEGANDPAILSDADLLAPALLNVQIGIRSYYGLQRIRSLLEAYLGDPDLAQPLADLPQHHVERLVGGLYSVLDDLETRPWGVKGTTLSKVLHRKRPESLVLHDSWVNACYVGADGPLPRASTRTWADYMVLLSVAMASDIRDQPEHFAALREASSASPALTDVRLLDILAWNVGQRRGSGDS